MVTLCNFCNARVHKFHFARLLTEFRGDSRAEKKMSTRTRFNFFNSRISGGDVLWHFGGTDTKVRFAQLAGDLPN